VRNAILPFLLALAWALTPSPAAASPAVPPAAGSAPPAFVARAAPALQETGGFRGRVRDPGGLPVSGAVVRAEGAAVRAVSDADGRYALGPLRAGVWRVAASAAGYADAAAVVRVPREGEAVALDLVLGGGPPRLEPVVTVVSREGPADGWRRVVTREEIARAGSLPAALRRVPGVFVKERGGSQEVSLRGGAPEATLVLWGDEPLLAPAGGAVDLATVPVAAVDSVEVVARGASARWGSGATAGVVRIHAAAPAGGAARLEAGAAVGSGAARRASVGARMPAGPFALSAAMSADGRDRSFAGRANEDARGAEAFLAVRLPGTGLGWSVAAQAAERGAPGPVHAPTPLARADAARALVSVAGDRAAGAWELRAEAAAQWARSDYRDPARGDDVGSRERSLALRLGGSRTAGEHRLEGGLETRLVRARGDAVAGRPRRVELGARLEDRWRPGSGPLRVSGSVRFDRIEADAAAGLPALAGEPAGEDPEPGGTRASTFVSPALAAALEAAPGLELRAFAGRSFRYPGFATLFFLPGIGVRANPALREERSRDLELGAAWTPRPGLRLEAAAFDRATDGTIVWLPDFRFVWSPRNLPRAVVRGAELSGRWAPRPDWELRGTWTWAPARFDFPGNRHPLPYRPAHLAAVGLGWTGAAVRAGAELRVTGSRTPNFAGTNRLPPYALLDLTLGWRRPASSGALVLELELENALDHRYEVVAGFPAAGRRLHAGVRWVPR
jgi:iron complex outermembrane receptor protein